MYQITNKTTMKIQVKNTMLRFSKERKMMGERNDCAVRATAVALGEKYNDIHEQYRKVGRQNLRGVKTYMIEDVLGNNLIGFNKETGVEFLETSNWNRRACPTISTLLKNPKFQVGSHIMVTRNHVFTLKDGVVFGNQNDDGRARVEGYYTTETGIQDS